MGKQANCQVSVEMVVSGGWIAAPVGVRDLEVIAMAMQQRG